MIRARCSSSVARSPIGSAATERVVQRVETYRDLADYECGNLDVLRHRNMAVIVYEVGILAIDDDLRPRWLKRKYLSRYEIAIEDDLLILRQGSIKPVIHRLTDGELLSSPRNYSPCDSSGTSPDD